MKIKKGSGKDIMDGDSSDADPANEPIKPNIWAGLTQA